MRWLSIAMVLAGCGGKGTDGASCDAVAAKMISFMGEGSSATPALAKLDAVAKTLLVEQCAEFEPTQRTCIVAAKDEAGMFTCFGAPAPALTCPAGAKRVGPRPDEDDDNEIARRFAMKREETWIEYCELDGAKHGPYRSAGRGREEIGAYEHGAKSGTWKRFARGSVIDQDEFKAGKRAGAHVEYDDAGGVRESTMFADDVEDGPYKRVASGDSPGVVGTYKAGAKVGTWTEVYADDKPKSTVTYVDDKRVGPTTEFHENGKPKLVATYVDDDFDGAYVETAESGATIAAGTYDHGKKVGTWSTATADGQKVWDGTFVAGKPSGTWTFYGAKNAVVATVKLDDAEAETNDDGVITAIDMTVPGKPSPHLEMFSTGQLKLSGGFLDGAKHGTWTEFDGRGRKIVEITWVAGKKTGPASSWYPESTQLMDRGTLEDSQWNGPWKHWFETGEVSDEGSYVKGTKVGTWTSYTRAGKATVTEH